MKKQIVATIIAGAIAGGPALAAIDLDTEKDKLSYSLGMMLGAQITKRFGDLNFEAVLEGLQKQHNDEETALPIAEAQATIQAFEEKAAEEAQKNAAANAEKATAAGAAYLEENKARDGVQVTDSGLQYEVITAAEGAKPAATDQVSVHYVGTLLDGTEFDSSVARGEPAEFGLGSVIPGWTEGLQLMNVGSKYRFVIPSELGYGERGAGGQIGPGETLIFEVELLEIK